MAAPTYLELKLFLPVDVYNATLTFIGERMRDTKTHDKEIDAKSLSSSILPSSTRQTKLCKTLKNNLRELVETECDCAKCFGKLVKDHTSPWHKVCVGESDDIAGLRNVRDGNTVMKKEFCESVFNEILQIDNHCVGFVSYSKSELAAKKDKFISEISEKKLKIETAKNNLTKDEVNFKKMKYDAQKEARNVSLTLDKRRLQEERLKGVDSKLVREAAAKDSLEIPKSLVERIRSEFITHAKQEIDRSGVHYGYKGKWEDRPVQLKIIWIGKSKHGFDITVDRVKTDRFKRERLVFEIIEKWGNLVMPDLDAIWED